MLFILPLPLIPTLMVTLLRGSLSLALAALLAIVLFITGAVANRRGLALEREYEQRKVARAPRMTRAALEVSPTARAAMIRRVARTRFTQICSASEAF